jgi:hypothetical protein
MKGTALSMIHERPTGWSKGERKLSQEARVMSRDQKTQDRDGGRRQTNTTNGGEQHHKSRTNTGKGEETKKGEDKR